MSAATFVATHCGERFAGVDGAAEFVEHMRVEHGARPLRPGTKWTWEKHGAAGWRNGEIEPCIPWTPPKRNATVEQIAAKWRDEVEYYDTNERLEVAA